jgi:Zn-dependent peptidase ImmA (M78 family)/DNA-binding XRE family transcriptional regulator
VNPTRLSLARRRRGLTKKALAERTGVAIRTLTAYERGEIEAGQDFVSRLAAALEFPEPFFYGDDLQEPRPDGASFRSLSRMTARDRDRALASGAFGFALFDWIEERFDIPAVDVPDLSGVADPEGASEIVRAQWGMGTKPVPNMVHLLESHGVAVLTLHEEAREVDAFSAWRNERPFVFLNTKKSAEKARMDAAHELGHLVLHRHQKKTRRDIEKEAKDFASALLMPRADVLAMARRNPTERAIIADKKRWGVSAIALVVRLHRLNLITEWHYRQLCMLIDRVDEPEPMAREQSKLLDRVFGHMRDEGVTRRQVATDLLLPLRDLNSLMFGLVLTQHDGGKIGSDRTPGTANLRLVSPK